MCPQALSKFLKCVNWEQSSESQQALELMMRWAPIDPNQALELLGPSFTHPAVRAYAVCRLQQAPDEVGVAGGVAEGAAAVGETGDGSARRGTACCWQQHETAARRCIVV